MKLENSFMHRQLWEKVYDVMELTGYNIKTNIKKKSSGQNITTMIESNQANSNCKLVT